MSSTAKKTATKSENGNLQGPPVTCGHCGRVGNYQDCGASLTCPMKNGSPGTTLTPQHAVIKCDRCGIERACSAPAAIFGKGVREATCQASADTCEATFVFIGQGSVSSATDAPQEG